MRDIVTVNFKANDEIDGQRQLFAFAADDYKGATGKVAMRAMGAILEEKDDEKSILEFVDNADRELSDIVVFDINYISNKKVQQVLELLRLKQTEYKELQDVYDDRIVFARM